MGAWRGIAAVVVVGATLAGTAAAEQRKEPPRGVVEDCSSRSGFGEALRDYRRPANLAVGPLAIRHAGVMVPWFEPGQKLFVEVKGGHRVTLELSRRTRRGAGLGFVAPRDPLQWTVRNTRRVVTFVACRRGETPPSARPDGWPVTGWVGSLNARSPRCVPLFVWVDDEPTPRRAVIPYGVRDCA
jgi:hypothetical protein